MGQLCATLAVAHYDNALMDSPKRREQLRRTFSEDAELYDRTRPGYPPALFDDLASLGDLRPGARIMEIGCGTGQATRPLAERGYRVTAVDLGGDMVAVARRNLATFPSVEFEVTDFESWRLPEEPFDAVISATAFHWLDPSLRLAKTAAALHAEGILALISTEHVAGGDIEFFHEAQACYEHWDPSTPPGLRLSPADAIPANTTELDDSGFFEPAIIRRYTWNQTYTASEYRNLLLTYSGHRALDPPLQRGLLECINDLIETRYSGQITKQYMNQLTVSRRRS